MTCIIGLEYNNKVYIGGDSAASTYDEIRIINQDKVFKVDNLIFGYAGSPRVSQIIQYHLKISEHNNFKDDLTYMVKVVIEDMRKCLTTYGVDDEKIREDFYAVCLIGYNHKLYCIYSDYQVHSIKDGLLSVGSGSSYALGAMYVLKDLEPRQRILKSLEASAYFSTTVDKPFKVLSL